MNELELMDWFDTCGHEVALVISNKGDFTGIAISKDTQDTFKASGRDRLKVLSDLRDMLSGTYK